MRGPYHAVALIGMRSKIPSQPARAGQLYFPYKPTPQKLCY